MYKRRRNCSSLIRKRKKQFRVALDIKDVTDNKNFGKQSIHYFWIKQNHETMILLEKEKVVTGNSEIAKTLNTYFINVVKSIEIIESGIVYQLY